MNWPLGDKLAKFEQRTAPGGGMHAEDDGATGEHLKSKSIPNVSTARLLRRLEHLHHGLHTSDGLRVFDEPRRALIERGCHLRMVRHELRLRGALRTDCQRCKGVRAT